MLLTFLVCVGWGLGRCEASGSAVKSASWYEHTTVVKAVVGLVGACCQAGRGRGCWRGSVRGSMDGGGAVVRPRGACDSETLALEAFVIVVPRAAVRRLAEAWRTIAGE